MGIKPVMYFKYVAPQVRKKHLSLPILNFIRYIFVKKEKEIYHVKINELFTLFKN